MKHIKEYKKAKESLEQAYNLDKKIIGELKEQRSKLEVVEANISELEVNLEFLKHLKASKVIAFIVSTLTMMLTLGISSFFLAQITLSNTALILLIPWLYILGTRLFKVINDKIINNTLIKYNKTWEDYPEDIHDSKVEYMKVLKIKIKEAEALQADIKENEEVRLIVAKVINELDEMIEYINNLNYNNTIEDVPTKSMVRERKLNNGKII